MKNIQRILFFAVCLCTAFTVQAQSLTVTGKVIDAEGLEVIGANITLKGASGVGSISDLSGNYRLKVDNAAKAILVFSYIGMKTQEVLVKGKAVINVTLQSDAKALVQGAKEYGKVLELNNHSMDPDCNRQNAVENDTVMLELCKKYQVPVVMDSDAHFDLLIGEFDRARNLLEKLDFPEELVLNRSVDAIRKYVNRKF